ncbi:MAG TPA: FtsK/SpoIIIE domain-containing protein, partial [Dongiaceae bacterium]|nr:FtsK/SpoIIIE domain-containing protein [Dongiaceae bacterium]
MNSHLGANRTLELLGQLRDTVREFATREETLRADFKARAGKLARQYEAENAALATQTATETSTAEVNFQVARDNLELEYERRTARIERARKNSREHHNTSIEEEWSRQKFAVQRNILQADRDRDAALQQAETEAAEFTRELTVRGEALAVLEQRARSAAGAYGKFRQLLQHPPETGAVPPPAPEALLKPLEAGLQQAEDRLGEFRRVALAQAFRFLPLWLLLPVLAGAAVLLVPAFHGRLTYPQAAGIAAGAWAVVVGLYFLGQKQAAPAAAQLASALERARRGYDAVAETAAVRHKANLEHIHAMHAQRTGELNAQWQGAADTAAKQRIAWGRKIDEQSGRIMGRNESRHASRVGRLDGEYARQTATLKATAATRQQELNAAHAEKKNKLAAEETEHWQQLVADWTERTRNLYDQINAVSGTAAELFPPWPSFAGKKWTPPATFSHAAQFGRMAVDVAGLAGALPKDRQLALPGAARFELPLCLSIPDNGSILFETKDTGRAEVIAALNSIILRLLATAPPGRVSFTIIDPVELGQDFAGLMHLADFEERLINSRIWTQPAQIEQQLANLNEHIEKVTQMYLRNEYETIAEYNEQAGRIAEKYHFLVVADFPVNFSDIAAKRLISIAASGARCGVYTLVHWDQRRAAPLEFVPAEMRKNSLVLRHQNGQFTVADQSFPGTTLHLEAPPTPEVATELLQQIGQASVDSNRVEMPFAEIVPGPDEIWSLDTTNELRVPIGRTGATKLQYLALGKGTRQHALLAGKTGSGKSTLFHVLITNLALWCSPEQVEFYLVDFKKGVEFKCYATHQLPHARVVAIESDREFGLSVLQRIDDELRRRGDWFRQLGVQDVAGYKKAGGTEKIPRTLLIIDEFQEFFVEDDRVAQGAALLLDRIVRQGRAFGIHVLLGSQTLGGAYTLARTTLGQMVVRIALQCNEADAYLIMDENNPAPRLLSRPGEAIYNDAAGAIEGNSPFQIVWLPDEEREGYLDQVQERAQQAARTMPAPIVFEGNAPADVRENRLLRQCLETRPAKPPGAARLWLGAPNSIKGPTEAVFRRQSGNHLLIVGQRDEAALALLATGLIALAAQYPRGTVRFVLFDSTAPGSPERAFLEQVVRSLPHEVTLARDVSLDELMGGLATELESRNDPEYAAKAPATFVLILGLQRFKALRYEEDFSYSTDDAKPAVKPATVFNNLVCEGASLGMHVVATCDSGNNVSRFLSRKALGEFEMRVAFQMSANDSAALIDSPKAGDLGLYRAIFHNAQEGYQETFRPYA